MEKTIVAGSIDITSLLKARTVFERFRSDMKDDRDEAGAVQAFEFCYELTWKTLKKELRQPLHATPSEQQPPTN